MIETLLPGTSCKHLCTEVRARDSEHVKWWKACLWVFWVISLIFLWHRKLKKILRRQNFLGRVGMLTNYFFTWSNSHCLFVVRWYVRFRLSWRKWEWFRVRIRDGVCFLVLNFVADVLMKAYNTSLYPGSRVFWSLRTIGCPWKSSGSQGNNWSARGAFLRAE